MRRSGRTNALAYLSFAWSLSGEEKKNGSKKLTPSVNILKLFASLITKLARFSIASFLLYLWGRLLALLGNIWTGPESLAGVNCPMSGASVTKKKNVFIKSTPGGFSIGEETPTTCRCRRRTSTERRSTTSKNTPTNRRGCRGDERDGATKVCSIEFERRLRRRVFTAAFSAETRTAAAELVLAPWRLERRDTKKKTNRS